MSATYPSRELGRIARFDYGKSQTAVRSLDGTIPVYGTGGLMEYANAFLHPGPSVIVGRKGSLGNPLYSEGPFWAVDTTYYVAECNGSMRWLHYVLCSLRLENFNEATGVPSLARPTLNGIRVPLPSSDEQNGIVRILAKIDHAIEQTEALLTKQQRIKNGLMHDLLTRGLDARGRLRDPLIHAFKPSSYGPIPQEWDVSPALALCDAVIDCKNRTPPSTPSGHPVIRTPNVRNGRFVYEDLALTDNASYEVWVSRGKPRVGDVVITREAPFGEACQIPADIPAACLGQRMMMYQPNPTKLRADYLVYAIYSRSVQRRLLELAGGSTVGHIRVGDVRSLPIPHPRSTDEQADVCVALNSLSSIDTDTRLSLLKLTKLKAGLMLDLLTGRIPVAALLSNPKVAISS